jgi:hypothetical protein
VENKKKKVKNVVWADSNPFRPTSSLNHCVAQLQTSCARRFPADPDRRARSGSRCAVTLPRPCVAVGWAPAVSAFSSTVSHPPRDLGLELAHLQGFQRRQVPAQRYKVYCAPC